MADGYELTGRWGFASGCDHATTFFANAVESVTEGRPALRVAVLDRAEVTIEDTWYVAGLRGTGSHHFTVAGVTVPRERTFVPLVGPPCVDVAIARIPSPAVFALGIAAVAIGVAQGALDTVVDLAQDKVPLLAPGPLAADSAVPPRPRPGRRPAGAARSLVEAATGRLWERATAGAEATLDDRARRRAAATWATEAAVGHRGELAYRAGGGGAVYETSPLQRRLRDVHAMTQHFLVRPDSYAIAGANPAGQGLSAPGALSSLPADRVDGLPLLLPRRPGARRSGLPDPHIVGVFDVEPMRQSAAVTSPAANQPQRAESPVCGRVRDRPHPHGNDNGLR